MQERQSLGARLTVPRLSTGFSAALRERLGLPQDAPANEYELSRNAHSVTSDSP
jgi:hypothetical protein